MEYEVTEQSYYLCGSYFVKCKAQKLLALGTSESTTYLVGRYNQRSTCYTISTYVGASGKTQTYEQSIRHSEHGRRFAYSPRPKKLSMIRAPVELCK